MRVWIFEHPIIWALVITMSALAAALLQEPLLHGNGWGVLLTTSTVGLPFAAMISVLSILVFAETGVHVYTSEFWSFTVLWLGMPLALAAGGIAVGLVNKSLLLTQNVALNRLAFYVAALIISGLIWALALTWWLNIRKGYRAARVYGRAFLIIATAGVFASILAFAIGHLIHKSVLLLVVSVCEQIASGLYLLVVTRADRSTGSAYA